MYVAHQFAGIRAMNELTEHVKSRFCKYGTVKATSGKMQDVFTWELKYKNEGVYAEVIDFSLLEDDTDDKIDYLVDDSDSDIDD